MRKFRRRILAFIKNLLLTFLLLSCQETATSNSLEINKSVKKQVFNEIAGFMKILYPSNTIDTVFLNPLQIILSPKHIIEINNDEWEWGKQTIKDIKLTGLNNAAKAKKIESFVQQNFKYKIRNPETIHEILEIGGGNCLSHAILGIYLLRLAGIPAKICYEFHLRKPFFIDGIRARSKKTGIFGSGYNTHVWVMFFDGSDWQPYDSALGIIGLDEFFKVRAAAKDGGNIFKPKTITGPPFLILQETGTGYTDMENITFQLWNMDFEWNNKKVSSDTWIGFIEQFYDKGYEYFEKPLDKTKYNEIKKMSQEWFH